jgi:tetratricopeptide (TPR) repeat protein
MDRNLYVSLARRAADLVDQGEYREAIEIFEQFVASDLPDFDKGITWVNIATVRDKMGDRTAALASYEQALECERRTSSYFIVQQHASYLSQLGMYEESMASYRALIDRADVKPEDAEIFRANLVTLGKLAGKSGKA